MVLFLLLAVLLITCVIWAIVLLKNVINLDLFHGSSKGADVNSKTFKASHNGFLSEAEIQKLLPVASTNSWTLAKVLYQHRIWRRTLSSLKGGDVKLYSLTLRVKSSSQNLVKFIGRLGGMREWRPGISDVSSICSSAFGDGQADRQVVRWRQRRLGLGIITDSLAEENVITWCLEPLLESECTMSRLIVSNGKYPGVFERMENSGTTTAFICQPIIGLENDQCRLTAMTTGDIHRLAEECLCLSDHFALHRAPVENSQPTPTSPHNDHDSQPPADAHISETKDPPTGAASSIASDAHVQQLSIRGSSADSPCNEEHMVEGDSQYSDYTEETDGTDGAEAISNLQDSSDGDDYAEATEDNLITNGATDLSKSFSQSQSATSRSNLSRSKTTESSVSRNRSFPQLADISNSKELPGRKEKVEGYTNVVFLRGLSTETVPVDYKTLSNTCAAELLGEVLNATNLVQKQKGERGPVEDVPVVGWVFESTDKSVAILQKYSQNSTRYKSWLGKGLIKEKPDVVWQTILNPYSRYIYDDMLKDLTVICDLGNGMKLLRLFYSTNNVLRKDCREFYVLQAQRIVDKKRILTFCSFDCPEEETKDCPRGKFAPSGWIIEPIVSKNKNIYSIVTYLSQIDLCDLSTSGVQQFEEELICKQPRAIADIRDYLTVLNS